MLVHDESSLVLGRTEAYSAMFGAAGESGGVNLQSSVAAYGLAQCPNSNFVDRSGVPVWAVYRATPGAALPFLPYSDLWIQHAAHEYTE